MDESQIEELERKKRYLKRYRKNIALINRLENKLVDKIERIRRIKSPSFSDMPKGRKPIDVSDLISDKVELEARIRRLKDRGKTLKSETLIIIDSIDDVRYAEILESFMIDCKSLEDIAEDMGYSQRHIERLYSEAILSVSVECR